MAFKYCILNGELTEQDKACISPFDRGFMYGDGAFDTLYAPKGVPVLFDEHMARLYENLHKLEITLPYTKDELHGLIIQLIEKNGLKNIESSIRITVTRGINQGKMFYTSASPTLLIAATEVPERIKRLRETGLKCMIASVRKFAGNPVYSVKSLNFIWSIMGMREALASGCDECLFFNDSGNLSEGSTSNVFIVKNNSVATPSDDSGILPGVTRDYLLRLLRVEGIDVVKKSISREELVEADEVFLTSSVRGVVSVKSIDETLFNTTFTKDIQKVYFNTLNH